MSSKKTKTVTKAKAVKKTTTEPEKGTVKTTTMKLKKGTVKTFPGVIPSTGIANAVIHEVPQPQVAVTEVKKMVEQSRKLEIVCFGKKAPLSTALAGSMSRLLVDKIEMAAYYTGEHSVNLAREGRIPVRFASAKINSVKDLQDWCVRNGLAFTESHMTMLTINARL